MIRLSLIVVIFIVATITISAQTDWQLMTFDFNSEHTTESNDSITKFQYNYTDVPKLEDKWYSWFDTIIHRTRGDYSGKLLDGYFIQYDKKGNMCVKGQYYFGLKNWTWKYWYSNGQLKQIQNWKNGVKDGIFTEYLPTGEISSQKEFKNGLKSGEWLIYKSDTVYSRKEYKKGKEIKKK